MKGRWDQIQKRYAILYFRKHVAFWRNVLKDMVNNQRILISLVSLLGTVLHTMIRSSQSTSFLDYAPFEICNTNLPKIRSQKETCLPSSKHGSVCMLYHMVIQDLETLCAIYGKWAMAPSCITKRLLLPLLQFSHSECLGLWKRRQS